MFRTFLTAAVIAAATTVAVAAAPADAAAPTRIPTHTTEHITTRGSGVTMTGRVLNNHGVPLPAGFTVQLVGHPAGTHITDTVFAAGHTDPYGRYTVHAAHRRYGWTYAAKVLPGRQMTNFYAGSTGQHLAAR